MSQPDIVIYLSGWCPYCRRARQLLSDKRLAFKEINVEEDARLREEMVTRSGCRTVPQIFIGDKHIGGCDDLLALDARGELDHLTQGV